jgi:hypothetical protein
MPAASYPRPQPAEADVTALAAGLASVLDDQGASESFDDLVHHYLTAKHAIEDSAFGCRDGSTLLRKAATALLQFAASVEAMKAVGESLSKRPRGELPDEVDRACDAIRDLEDLDDPNELIGKLSDLFRHGKVWLNEDGRGINEAVSDRLWSVMSAALKASKAEAAS